MNRIKLHILLAVYLLLTATRLTTQAQNVQMHYDFGHALYDSERGRAHWTSTVEMFRPDAWGNTFFFVDMDYTNDGVSGAYWEISRELRWWKAPVALHVEYNGGLNHIRNAYLAGATYAWNHPDFTRGFALMAMYKYIQRAPEPNSFQLTATWYVHVAAGRFTFSGFADWWREPGRAGDFAFISEPQLWVNLNRFPCIDPHFNLSLGSEVELSNNFAGQDGFRVNPTIAAKWTF